MTLCIRISSPLPTLLNLVVVMLTVHSSAENTLRMQFFQTANLDLDSAVGDYFTVV